MRVVFTVSVCPPCRLGRTSPRSLERNSSLGNSMEESESWTQTTTGRLVLALVCVAAVGIAAWEIRSYFHGDTPGDPNSLTYVDSESGKTFSHENTIGEMVPIVSPFTGNRTGYPGVPCYWTPDGQLKKDPTWLILNQTLGRRGPTFCPFCGRLVRPMQPIPVPGDKPPPTQQELLHSNPAALTSSTP